MNYVNEAIKRQPFSDKSEMDEAIKEHIAEHGKALNDTTIEILRLLSRYAVKYPGVAFLKYGTIARAIGKSRITVIRNITKLVIAGIIEKVAVMREVNGGNGANMYVIKPSKLTDDTPAVISRKESEKATETRLEDVKTESEPCSFNKLNTFINNTYSNRPQSLYETFKSTVNNFVNDSKLTNKLYGIFVAQTSYFSNRTEFLTEGLEALRIAFMATKRKSIRNLAGYYNGVLSQLLDKQYEAMNEELFEGYYEKEQRKARQQLAEELNELGVY